MASEDSNSDHDAAEHSQSANESSSDEQTSGDKIDVTDNTSIDVRKRKRLTKRRTATSQQSENSTDTEDEDDVRQPKVMSVVTLPETKDKTTRKVNKDDPLTSRTGGAYIPPARLLLMQQEITDKSSVAYQRLAWQALKKSINGLINKINISNMKVIVRELFAENIIRGRGVLCQAIMQAQSNSPTFSHVFAFLAAIINTSFPNIGELLIKRLVLNFKRAYRRNDKFKCVSSVKFLAHLINVQMTHEVLALEMLTVLLENPTDDSVEMAVTFLRECGHKLTELSPKGVNAIFDTLRHILHEAELEKRTLYMIEVIAQVRKDGFRDNPSLIDEFRDMSSMIEDDQVTHMIMLDDAVDGEEILNVFKADDDFVDNEAKYDNIKKVLLGQSAVAAQSGSSESDSDGSSSTSSSSSDSEDEEKKLSAPIIDNTETNMITLRRTIYLTIQSSLDFEETVHKLLKMSLKEGHEKELAHMVVDCCAQERTYLKYFGLLAQRLCVVNSSYVGPFQDVFVATYNTAHRLEIGKLRNVCRLFAHLLFTDAIDWGVLSVIHLNEAETTSSSRVFIKIMMLEVTEYMGLAKLIERLHDPVLQVTSLDGLFPRDDPANTRFAINFFTSIGLGILTEELRAHLKNNPKPVARVMPMVQQKADDPSSTSSSDSSSSDSDDSSSESDSQCRRDERIDSRQQHRSPRRHASPVRSSKHSHRGSAEDMDSSRSKHHRGRELERYKSGKADSKTDFRHTHHSRPDREREDSELKRKYDDHRSDRYREELRKNDDDDYKRMKRRDNRSRNGSSESRRHSKSADSRYERLTRNESDSDRRTSYDERMKSSSKRVMSDEDDKSHPDHRSQSNNTGDRPDKYPRDEREKTKSKVVDDVDSASRRDRTRDKKDRRRSHSSDSRRKSRRGRRESRSPTRKDRSSNRRRHDSSDLEMNSRADAKRSRQPTSPGRIY